MTTRSPGYPYTTLPDSTQSLLRWLIARLKRGTLPAEAQRIIDDAGGGGCESLQLRRKALANHRAR